MGRSRCCVGGCSNVPGNGVSLHTFPREETARKKWIKAIQMTGSDCSRAGWSGPQKDKSANAQLVCSEHFELSMYSLTTRTNWSLGINYRPILNEGAVPTLFGENVRTCNVEKTTPRPVVRKREVARILNDYNQQLQVKESSPVVPDLPTVGILTVNTTSSPPADVESTTTTNMLLRDLQAIRESNSDDSQISPSIHDDEFIQSTSSPHTVTETHSHISPSLHENELHLHSTITTTTGLQSTTETSASASSMHQELKNQRVRTKDRHLVMNKCKKKTDKCPCEKCCVTTSVKGTQINRKPPLIKRKTKGTETLMEHHITYSTSSTQYSESDIAARKTTPCPDVPPTTHCLASPLHLPTHISTPVRKKPVQATIDSPHNRSFMSMSSYGMADDEAVDPDYDPEASFFSESEDDDGKQSDIRGQRKFLVFEDNLMELFRQCELCRHATEGKVCNVKGSYVAIQQRCECGHTRKWESQPKVKGVPAGNILLSAAILFSGCSPSKVLRIFKFVNILCIGISTFFKHQKTVLWPAIERVWTKCNDKVIDSLVNLEDELVVAGDGRADSPGHSAKFGVYSMIDMNSGKVIALELVQSNEVQSSYHMELEGLRRAIDHLHERGLSFGEIITDRHVQIQKWIRETLPGTVHSFDVWHIGKAVKKKILALSKLKDCGPVAQWMKSITNHLYWAASSSKGQDGTLVEAKWSSVINHVQNIHAGHSDLFQNCQHGPIEDNREWLPRGSKVSVKLEDIVLNKRLCKDIQKLSTGFQTSTLEAFHSVINHFAPKMLAFSFHGQLCRQYLSALHFNENVKRERRVGKNGKLHVKVVFPKYKSNNEFSVKFVNEDMTFNYVYELLDMTIKLCGEVHEVQTPAPPPLTSGKRKPTKVEVTKCLASKCKKLRY